MTPLERAARAIEADLERQQRDEFLNFEVIDGRLDAKALVRAVLTAIREPTREMADAGSIAAFNEEREARRRAKEFEARAGGKPAWSDERGAAAWQAMIDNLLDGTYPEIGLP